MQQQTVELKAKNAQMARRLVAFALFFNLASVLALCPMVMVGGGGVAMTLVLALLVDVPIALYAFSQDVPFVWGCQQTFNKVCQGLGGNFTYEGFSLGNSIREGLKARPGQYVGNQTKTVYPTLRTVTGTREAWEGLVKPNPGQDVSDFNANADAFALAYHAQFCSFDIAHKGLLRIRVGSVPIPPAFDYDFQEP